MTNVIDFAGRSKTAPSGRSVTEKGNFMSNQIVGAMSVALWEATKERLNETLKHHSWVERGRRFSSDVPELVHEIERLRAIVLATTENVTALQVASTARLDGQRGSRWLDAHGDEIMPIMVAIAGEVWRANNKFGTPTDLVGRPDGIGGVESVEWMERAKAKCEASMKAGTVSWAEVLEEECAEVAAAATLDEAKIETRQVVATGLRWLAAIAAREAKQQKCDTGTSNVLDSATTS